MSENLWKPPETGRLRRFPAGFQQVSKFFIYNSCFKIFFSIVLIRELAKNLCGRFPEVSSRFPDNPSLTDHTVCAREGARASELTRDSCASVILVMKNACT